MKDKKSKRIVYILGIIVLICIACYFVMAIGNRLSPPKQQGAQAEAPATPTSAAALPAPATEAAVEPTTEAQPTDTPAPSVDFSFLRQWKPNDEPNSFGADILLKDDLSEEQLVSFIKRLSRDSDPVIIRVWTSQEAYKDEGGTTEEFKKGFIAFYVKNSTVQGAYAGLNEIRWMQEIGKFSHLLGQATKF